MNIKALIKSLPLQTNPKKYEQFVRELDYKKMLAEDPVEIRDKYYLENENLVETDLAHTSATYELHNKLNEKYNLSEVATADTDFEKVIQVLNWLTQNTFYNGAQIHSLTDNTLDILKYAFGKSFKKALCCRLKAISFADCLVAVGIKAYPVCMCSTVLKNCHFTCQAYISELDKWCVFDPSFGCWFADKAGNPIDIFEMREIFLQGDEPVVKGYNFNGTTECFDVYINCFLKMCISNLSTWRDNSMGRRDKTKIIDKKKFNGKIPNEKPNEENLMSGLKKVRVCEYTYILNDIRGKEQGRIKANIYLDGVCLDSFCVAYKYRGAKKYRYGKQLLDSIIEEAKSNNCKRIIVVPKAEEIYDEDVPLMSLEELRRKYTNLGFTLIESQRCPEYEKEMQLIL